MLGPDIINDAVVGEEVLTMPDPIVVWVGVPVEDVHPESQRRVPGHHLLYYEDSLFFLEIENSFGSLKS